jgi:hypothetical protein
MAKKVAQTAYQLKASLLANYLCQELNYPSHNRNFIYLVYSSIKTHIDSLFI